MNIITNYTRASHDARWVRWREEHPGCTESLEEYIEMLPGQEKTTAQDRWCHDASWVRWRESHPGSQMTLDEWLHCVRRHEREVDDASLNSVIRSHDFVQPAHFGPYAPTPPQFKTELRSYQQQAVHWLLQVKRGILADDMGLGKTLSMLAAMCSIPISAGGAKTTLVILPKSLLKSWAKEVDKHSKPGAISCHTIHGSKAAKAMTHQQIMAFDIILTTRHTVLNEIKAFGIFYTSQRRGNQKKLPKNGWPILGIPPYQKQESPGWLAYKCVVLDEAHFMRTPETEFARTLLSITAEYRYCITGTPLQNAHDDFFPLLSFIHHEAGADLGKFRSEIAAPAKKGKYEKLHGVLNQCLLQRTKATTVDGERLVKLPKQTIKRHHAQFDMIEAAIYKELLNDLKFELKAFKLSHRFQEVLSTITRLIQCSCDPRLLFAKQSRTIGHQDKKPKLGKAKTSEKVATLMRDAQPVSTKVRMLMRILDQRLAENPNMKFIVFAEFTGFLKIIKKHLEAVGLTIGLYDGSIASVDNREKTIDYWRTNQQGLCMTTGSGGEGLTLNEAEDIFIMNISWNPKKDQQAYDRNYRIGQNKEVTVHIILIPYLPDHRPDRPSIGIDTVIVKKQQQKLKWAAASAARSFTDEGDIDVEGFAMGARDVAEMLGESDDELPDDDLGLIDSLEELSDESMEAGGEDLEKMDLDDE